MKLTVRLFAGLRERAGRDALELDGLPDELDVAGLKREVERRFPELGPLDHVRGVLGTRYVPDRTPVEPEAELSLLPPVSGGSGGSGEDEQLERGVFEILAEELDPRACQARVAHPSCGACVVFTGTTRETNRGQGVLRLDYEAFEEMAGAEMARIFEECRERFATDAETRLRMLCQHRRGTVEVGGPSVVIAVASPHRDAAFAAARFLIDELKARVPLWKQEHYEGGHHWIGERS